MQNLETFWNWFKVNEPELRSLRSPSEPLWDLALDRLHDVDERLWIEMSRPYDGIRDFIVTAQGNPEAFDIAEALVAAAPEMPAWQIIALKPGMGFDFKSDYAGLSLDSREMWFLPLENPGCPGLLGLRIGIPGLEPQPAEDVLDAVLMMLDTGLGERTAATEIRHVEVSTLPPNPESLGYIELPELPEYLRWRARKVN
ncbi:MAG: hypothetical protein WA294_13205 [Acidobacteriaceae bacterium]